MTEDERDDLIDRLPDDMILWAVDDELDWWQGDPWTYAKWREVLGHPRAHPGCCRTCGCCTSCTLGVFYDGVVSSVVRELDKLGALRTLEITASGPITPPAPCSPVLGSPGGRDDTIEHDETRSS